MKSRRILVLSLLALSVTTVGCKARSTARLDQIEYRPASPSADDPVQEWSFSYDDEGYLLKVEQDSGDNPVRELLLSYREGHLSNITTEVDGDEVYETDFEFEDGRFTRLVSSYLVSWVEDGLITLSYNIDFEQVHDLNYDDQGRWASTDITTDIVSTTVADVPVLGQSTTVRSTDVEWEIEYDYNDRGDLTERKESSTRIEVETTDGEETARETVEESSELELDYADDNRLDQLTYTSNGAETQIRFRYDQDGHVIELEQEDAAGTGEWDFDYDDDGRVSRIEDNNGNEWVFDYDDGAVRGLTFGLGGVVSGGDFFDLRGVDFGEPTPVNVLGAAP